jgi:hypothetical protein
MEIHEQILVTVNAINLLRNVLIRTYDFKISPLQDVYRVFSNFLAESDVSLSTLVQESHRILTSPLDNKSLLQHVDLIFRFYLPLYSLICCT